MTFTYTYRASSGAVAEDVIEAKSRSSAFALLRERGITPMSVTEGGEISSSPSASGNCPCCKAPPKLIPVILGVIALAALVACFFAFPSSKSAPENRKKTSRIADVKPAKAKQHSAATASKDSPAPAAAAAVKDAPSAAASSTNLAGEAKAPEKKERKVTIVRRPGAIDPRKVFSERSDRTINRVLSLRVGDSVVGNVIPPRFEESFAESLKVPIKILPDDAPNEIEAKQNVIAAREYIVAEMKARNISATQVLSETIDELKASAESRKKIIKALAAMKKEGSSAEEMRATLNDANKLLQDMAPGAREIRMPTIESNISSSVPNEEEKQ